MREGCARPHAVRSPAALPPRSSRSTPARPPLTSAHCRTAPAHGPLTVRSGSARDRSGLPRERTPFAPPRPPSAPPHMHPQRSRRASGGDGNVSHDPLGASQGARTSGRLALQYGRIAPCSWSRADESSRPGGLLLAGSLRGCRSGTSCCEHRYRRRPSRGLPDGVERPVDGTTTISAPIYGGSVGDQSHARRTGRALTVDSAPAESRAGCSHRSAARTGAPALLISLGRSNRGSLAIVPLGSTALRRTHPSPSSLTHRIGLPYCAGLPSTDGKTYPASQVRMTPASSSGPARSIEVHADAGGFGASL